jgi:hypothetical protein
MTCPCCETLRRVATRWAGAVREGRPVRHVRPIGEVTDCSRLWAVSEQLRREPVGLLRRVAALVVAALLTTWAVWAVVAS